MLYQEISRALAFPLIGLMLWACVSQQEYDALQRENQRLRAQLAEEQARQRTYRGGFIFTPAEEQARRTGAATILSGPLPLVPVVPGPARAPRPASRPPRDPTPIVSFKPTTPARSELFRALLSDSQGSRPFEPARIQLMRQCWNELHFPAVNFAQWISETTDVDIMTVATCINAKAGEVPD